jgi:hypothetical protein
LFEFYEFVENGQFDAVFAFASEDPPDGIFKDWMASIPESAPARTKWQGGDFTSDSLRAKKRG